MKNIFCIIALLLTHRLCESNSFAAVDNTGDYYYYYDNEEGDGDDNSGSEYYEDGYEETNELPEPIIEPIQPQIIHKRGFDAPIHGMRLPRIRKPLLDEKYVNLTAEMFMCIPRADSGVILYNDTEIDENALHLENLTVDEMVVKLKGVAENAAMVGEAALAAAKSLNDPIQPKKLSFRELQEQRMKERREAEIERDKVKPKFLLGADCETLLCGACKVLVEEFGRAVFASVDIPEVRQIEQVLTNFSPDMCQSRELKLKYGDVVIEVCQQFLDNTLGYGDSLLSAYESDQRYDALLEADAMFAKKQKVCMTVGACSRSNFRFYNTPRSMFQEHWDDACYVCQAVAYDLEERVLLTRTVTETNILPIAADTCNRLNLKDPYQGVCKTLTTGKMLDDIAWIAKVHSESVARQPRGYVRFGDRMCEEIKYCKKWVDQESKKQQEAEKTIEQVFY